MDTTSSVAVYSGTGANCHPYSGNTAYQTASGYAMNGYIVSFPWTYATITYGAGSGTPPYSYYTAPTAPILSYMAFTNATSDQIACQNAGFSNCP